MPATASVAQDLVCDTGELAAENGHVGGVYLAHHIPREYLPEGERAAPLWVEGFSAVFGVIVDLCKAEKIPSADELEDAFGLPEYEEKLHLFREYMILGANGEHILEALIEGAKEDWESGEFESAFLWGEDTKMWDALPTCPKHDFNWDLLLDCLAA